MQFPRLGPAGFPFPLPHRYLLCGSAIQDLIWSLHRRRKLWKQALPRIWLDIICSKLSSCTGSRSCLRGQLKMFPFTLSSSSLRLAKKVCTIQADHPAEAFSNMNVSHNYHPHTALSGTEGASPAKAVIDVLFILHVCRRHTQQSHIN